MEPTSSGTTVRKIFRGPVTEVRGLNVVTPTFRRPHVVSGYFPTDPEGLASIGEAVKGVQASGFYFILNPIPQDLMARCAGRLEVANGSSSLTCDHDIVRREIFLVDLDPVRPKGIMATEEEHQNAGSLALSVQAELEQAGWPLPILCDSGNGYHLLYRIDLPNDQPATDLLKAVLAAMGQRFSTPLVQVDTTTWNAGQLGKLYGTWVRKGDHTPDRPHRRSCVVLVPGDWADHPVPLDLLEGMAGSGPGPDPALDHGSGDEVQRWLARSGLVADGPQPWRGGQKWVFPVCPWDDSHVNRSAWLARFPSGALAAGCHHDSCAGRSWADLRAQYGPLGEEEPRFPARRQSSFRPSDLMPRDVTPDLDLGTVNCIAEFDPWIQGAMNGKGSSRDKKRLISATIGEWLISKKRLLWEKNTERAYLLSENGRVIPLDEGGGSALRIALREAGMNATETLYAFMLAELESLTSKHGLPVELKYSAAPLERGVAVTSGPCEYWVVEEEGVPYRLQNGSQKVLFDSASSFAEWEFDLDQGGIGLSHFPCFNPPWRLPMEAPAYTEKVQQWLFRAWLTAAATGVRPLPLLAVLGGKGGGKSTFCRSVVQLFFGRKGNVSILPQDDRDFWSVVTSSGLVAWDNVDSEPPPWVGDAFASAITGAKRVTRKLYTDGDTIERESVAAMVINSRSAGFARPDVAERVLPLFIGEIPDDKRVAESDLSNHLLAHRAELLTYLATTSVQVAKIKREAKLAGTLPGRLPSRFLDFAFWLWASLKHVGMEEHVEDILNSWRVATSLAVGDSDPLLSALLEYAHEICPLENARPVEVAAILEAEGANLPWLGGGRRIASRLREIRASAELGGLAIVESEDLKTGQTLWTIRRMKGSQNEGNVD